MTAHDAAGPPESDTPGRVLATARVRAGLTLADVSTRSRVPIAALEAIDADDHRRIAAPVYVRGFVRLYAREVGLDPAEVVALLDRAIAGRMVNEAAPPATPEAAPEPRRSRRAALYSLAGVALVAGLLLVLFSVSSGPAPRDLDGDAAVEAPRVVPLPARIEGDEPDGAEPPPAGPEAP